MADEFSRLLLALGLKTVTCGSVTIHVLDGKPQKWEVKETGKIPVDNAPAQAHK